MGCRVSRNFENIHDDDARHGLCPNGDPTGVQFTSSMRGSQFIPLIKVTDYRCATR
jgi:hypothetical protein